MSITKFQAKCDLINFKGNPTVFVPLVCENVLKLTGTHACGNFKLWIGDSIKYYLVSSNIIFLFKNNYILVDR